MARQSGNVFMVGTIDDLTFYKMNGQYYVRKKSSLTGKRFKKDQRFENSRRNASYFGKAAKLSAIVYKMLPQEKKGHGLFGDMTAMTCCLLRSGLSKEQALKQLQDFWLPATGVKQSSIMQPSNKLSYNNKFNPFLACRFPNHFPVTPIQITALPHSQNTGTSSP